MISKEQYFEESKKIAEAIAFATEKHADQKRKCSGLPYLVHPMEVWQILRNNNCSITVQIAGLLHDIAYCEEMVTREDRMNHGRRSATIARPFLESLGLSADAVNEICYGIAIHVDDEADFQWERTPFCETVGDADNIDRFDAYRIYETLEYLSFSKMNLDDKREKVGSTIEKLNRFKEMKLGTATAKNLWIQRLDYYIGFYEKLKAQLDNSTAIL